MSPWGSIYIYIYGRQFTSSCRTPWSSAVAPSSPLTTSVCASCVHGLHQAVWVLQRLLRDPPPRHPDHQVMCQIVRVHLFASSGTTSSSASPSCSTPSSTPATAGCISIFYYDILHLRPSWRPSLLVPQTTTLGGAPSLPRPVLATPVCAIVPRGIFEPGKLGNVSPVGSWLHRLRHWPPFRLPRRVALFVHGGFPSAPLSSRRLSSVRGFLCGSLSSTISTTPRRPRLPYARHLRPRLFTLQFGCIDINTKGYHPHELLAGFLSSRSVCTAPTFQLRGDVSPSAFAFGFFSSLTVCGAPAVTAGGC
jgi:hypothetical protein